MTDESRLSTNLKANRAEMIECISQDNSGTFSATYYAKEIGYDAENALQHYQEIGSRLDIPPNPFLVPKLLRRIYDETLNDFLDLPPMPVTPLSGRLGPLFDARYCAARNGVSVEDVESYAIARLANDEWVDFHPILTRLDFEASRCLKPTVWIELLSDPDRSLVDSSFNLFSPKLYRKTATSRRFENELIDYLVDGMHSDGIPHIFCDYWYAEQHTDSRKQPLTRGDIWLDMLGDVNSYGDDISPFFEPLKFNHAHFTKHGATAELHPLQIFQNQRPPIIPPHAQVVPSAVVYAFLDRPINECSEECVTAQDTIEAIEVALSGARAAPENVELSICILNYNKPTHTVLSAIAAARHAPDSAEILILDNGSDPKDFELILRATQRYANIRVLRNPSNLYFGEGNNVLLDQSRGEKILFLNNDAYVGRTTIDTMKDYLDNTPGAAAAGVTFLFPNLEVQEAGGIISDCGQQIQLHKHSSLELQRGNAELKTPQPTQYISSACFCVKREVLDELGGYDAIFEPLYFEDSDLCKRLTSAGYRIDYLPWDYVIHYENASTREFLGDGFMDQISVNRDTFRRRWLYQPSGYRPRQMPMAVGARPAPERPNALIYTPYNIGIGGGERYILSVAVALAEKYNVTIATSGMISRTRVAFALDDLSIATTEKMILDVSTLDEAIRDSNFELMIVMGNEIVPSIPLFGKKNIYHCQFPFPSQNEDRWQISRLRQLDAVIVNSEYTKRHVRAQLLRHDIHCPIHVTYAPVKSATSSNHSSRQVSDQLRLVNIGRFEPGGHAKRQDIVVEIFKHVHSMGIKVHLTLVGGFSPSKRRKAYLKSLKENLDGLPADILVNASRATLETALSNGDIYVHGCGFGERISAAPERQEHFGISVVEGMMFGLIPIVYDGGGPAEISLNAGVGFRYRTIEAAAKAVIGVANMSPEARAEMVNRGKDYSKRFSDEMFQNRIRSLLDASVNPT